MKNFCIFCGSRLIDGRCGCADFISYYGAPAAPAYTPAPAPAPAAPAFEPAPVAPAAPAFEPAPAAPVAPAPAAAPAGKPMDSHFQSAGDL